MRECLRAAPADASEATAAALKSAQAYATRRAGDVSDQRVEVIARKPKEKRERLAHLEGVIRRGREVFLEVGRALEEIRTRDLYKPEYKSFAAYCRKKWEMSRSKADRYISWARVDEKLAPIGVKPENEAQAREIVRLRDFPEAALEAWNEVGEKNGGRHPSEALREAVEKKLARLVPVPEALEPAEAAEGLEIFGGIKEKYPKDAAPKHLGAAAKPAKRAMNARKKAEARAARPPLVSTGSDSIEIHHCEIRELAGHVEERSVDLVLTDPPYGGEHLPLFGELGAFAKRVLKPTGLLVSYMGNFHLPQAMNLIMEHVPWYWQMVVSHAQKDAAFTRGFHLDHKPLGVFGTPDPKFKETQRLSTIGGKGGDKDYHKWGQPIDEALYLVKTLSEAGDLVVDPFLGGGTTAAAAKRLGRRCVAGEKDYDTYQDALERVRAEPKPGVIVSAPPKEGDRVAVRLNDAERLALVLEALEGARGDVVVLRPQDIA